MLAALDTQAGDVQVILDTLATACTRYGRKNLRILYDALSTLAELVGNALAEPGLLRIFMPPLLAKWQSLADTDRDLLPLLECFTALITALGAPALLAVIMAGSDGLQHIVRIARLAANLLPFLQRKSSACLVLFNRDSSTAKLCLHYIDCSRKLCVSCV